MELLLHGSYDCVMGREVKHDKALGKSRCGCRSSRLWGENYAGVERTPQNQSILNSRFAIPFLCAAVWLYGADASCSCWTHSHCGDSTSTRSKRESTKCGMLITVPPSARGVTGDVVM
jgi:hypothetical protein